jgi:glycosyltransferase involved in cell wall biosynthesis
MLWFFTGLAALYLFIQLSYLYHWSKLQGIDPDSSFHPQTFVSVVIPARNEAEHILECIQSVTRQEYPTDLFEVIVVDDFSEDGTGDIVKDRIGPNVHLLQLSKANSQGGKKNALTAGIAQAKGDWIVTLDADCVMQSDCLRSSVYAYEIADAQIITGAVLIPKSKGVLEKFQSYELAGLMLITGSGFQSGIHHLANGAFLSFSKDAFQQIGGYKKNVSYASGDDMFLMEAISKKYPEQIFFLKSESALVTTHAEKDWRALISQRLRWASKNKGLANHKISFIWGFIWVYAVSLLITLGLSFSQPKVYLYGFLIMALSKFMADWLLIFVAMKFYRKPFSILGFLTSEIYQTSYIILIGLYRLAGLENYKWKGRTTQ